MSSLCQSAYHGCYFQQGEKDSFPVISLKALDNSLVDNSTMVDEDPARFKEGRDGDRLLIPCHALVVVHLEIGVV